MKAVGARKADPAQQRAAYNHERDRLIHQWVRGSTRRVAVAMQMAVQAEFGIPGEIYQGGHNYKISSKTIQRLRPIIRQMYDEIQSDLRARGVESVMLLRGIQSHVSIPGVLDSWTTDLETARKFGAYAILRQEIPRERIFMYHEGPGWQDGPTGKQYEYIVLSEVPR